MFNNEVTRALNQLASQIGSGVSNLGFRILLQQGQLTLGLDEFSSSVSQEADGSFLFYGEQETCQFTWRFQPFQDGFWVTLEVASTAELDCSTLESFSCDYRPTSGSLNDLQIPTLGLGWEIIGFYHPNEINEQRIQGSLIRGAFPNSRSAGVFLGTHLPQKHRHLYSVQQVDSERLHFTATTLYLPNIAKNRNLISETTWISTHFNLREALDIYSKHLPLLPAQQTPVGWSTWDYYFFSVTLADVIENMDAIRSDPLLSDQVKFIVMDDGWQHLNGEWQPNYKFPGGLERLADEISRRGFVPGIWTAPTLVNANSVTALRQYDLLVKNQYGDPINADVPGHYLLDPTHPKGREFLVELYTRLYQAGYRFFKVDFVYTLMDGKYFYDPTKGPYEVIAELFQIIRECISPESHLMGCSLPRECGPGLVDSHRIGMDIHNQWTHVEWIVQNLQFAGWEHTGLSTNDPDFLVVRGIDTSLEQETNVLNPEAHNPNPPRWRRGAVFNLDEARTWATLVSLSGGSVFLSDRLSRLNRQGLDLIHKVLQPSGVAAQPLDLGDGLYPSIWLMKLPASFRLALINWADTTKEISFIFSDYQIAAPERVKDFWSESSIVVQNGRLTFSLSSHACVYISWNLVGSNHQ